MHEMFMGRESASAPKDLDPAVEKVIQRCLDPNPKNRPATALDLARALPGGDPLAEALAAGDTPSPEMVAASEDTGALSVRAAVACLAVVIAGLSALVFWGSRNSIVNQTPMPYSPDVLEQKAREIAGRFGYIEPPVDEAHSFNYNSDYHNWAEKNLKPEEHRAQLERGQPTAIFFSYSRSPRYFVPANGRVTPEEPRRIPGWIDLWLDPQGRLIFFQAVPQRETEGSPADHHLAQTLDWAKLFEAAGLDVSRWTPIEPQEIPATAFDEHKAWLGSYAGSPQIPLRIEAAAWKGRPVSFEISGPWRSDPSAGSALSGFVGYSTGVIILITVLGAFLALHNLRIGRGDLNGAVRLATFIVVCSGMTGVLSAHHTPSGNELRTAFSVLQQALFFGALVWALYMAVEPYVRRHWPQALIGWTRALAGNLRDPLVAGHILVGITAGVATDVLGSAIRGLQGASSGVFGLPALEASGVVGNWFGDLSVPPAIALGGFLLYLLLKLLLRRSWLAVAVIAGVVAVRLALGSLIALPIALAEAAMLLAVSIRFGMLALSIAIIANPIDGYPLTSHFSAWFAPQGWMEVGFVLAIAIWNFRNALGGRKVLKGEFLEG
jgi:hypothetical protein